MCREVLSRERESERERQIVVSTHGMCREVLSRERERERESGEYK